MQRKSVSLVLMLALVCASCVFVQQPGMVHAAAGTFTVTTTADLSTNNPSCADPCSLRQAIIAADNAGAGSRIEFNISNSDAGYDGSNPNARTWTITVTNINGLPYVVADSITIDGNSQARNRGGNPNIFGPEIIIDGTNVTQAGGITLISNSNTIVGLGIVNFKGGNPTGTGIEVRGNSNIVQGNYIGIDKIGNSAAGNTGPGIWVRGNSNLIGGDSSASTTQFNVVSGNKSDGILVEGDTNQIRGNYIGTNRNGITIVPNTGNGINIRIQADGNIVGTDTDSTNAIYRNLISGNAKYGIVIRDSVSNKVYGNWLGIDDTGDKRLPNQSGGIQILSASQVAGLPTTGNIVGGTSSFARNIIAGNVGPGVNVSGLYATANIVANNNIGLSYSSKIPTGTGNNQTNGVLVDEGANHNIIGSSATSTGNTIAGNAGRGIQIVGNLVQNEASDANIVTGNTIGLNPSRTAAFSNTLDGVFIGVGANGNRVGGPTSADSNIIAGNGGAGIVISGTQTVSNTIAGNLIGLRSKPSNSVVTNNTCGTIAANTGDGILLMNGPDQTRIGGLTAAEGNLIGGNTGSGIAVLTATTTTIQSNQVGATRDATNPNRYYSCGNGQSGIRIANSSTNTITSTVVMNHLNGTGISIVGSGTTPNTLVGNQVNLNGQSGIRLNATAANTISNTTVLTNSGNGIWISASNTNLLAKNRVNSNGLNGIQVDGTSKDTTILASTIYTNTQNGILVQDVGTQRVKMLDNSISGNARGIQLAPETFEVTGDPNNPNHDINPPFAIHLDQTGKLTGRVLVDSSNAATLAASCITCKIQIFATNPKNLDGQGRAKLGEFNEVSANGYFTVTLGFVPGQLALTATDAYSNTSEFAVFNTIIDATHNLQIGPARSSTAIPGQIVTYVHQVTNTTTLDFTDLALSTKSLLGWTALGTPPAPISLAAGQSKPVTLTLTLPTGSAKNVVAGSVDNTGLTVRSTKITTATGTVTDTTTVLARFLLNVSPVAQSGSGLPGSPTVYQHTITNNGNLTGTVTLAAATDLGWNTSIDVPATITLAPGASRTVAISVAVPAGTIADTQAKTTLNIVVTDPAGETAKQVIDTTTVSNVQRATIVPNREADAAATQIVTFRHTVTNYGNGKATYKLTASSSLGSTFKFRSDTASITLNADNTFTVDNDTTGLNVFNFYIDVTVEGRANGGDRDTVTISLLDTNGNAVGGASVQDTIRVARGARDVPRLYLPLAFQLGR